MVSLSRRAFVAGSAAIVTLASSIRGADVSKKLKIVVTGGHPGDPEYGCGGTIARYTDLGHEATIVYLNRGQKGCSGKAASDCGALRSEEAARACEILKAQPKFFNEMDGEAVVDAGHYDDFRRLIESEKPDVLFAQWPIDNHRDHRAISMLAYDAWLKLRKSFAFYYYEVSDGEDTMMFKPTDYVDISTTEARKRAACYAHGSQSPDRFYKLQSEVAQFRGVESGHTQAEAFVRHIDSPGNPLI